jgi:hypothetical protein
LIHLSTDSAIHFELNQKSPSWSLEFVALANLLLAEYLSTARNAHFVDDDPAVLDDRLAV